MLKAQTISDPIAQKEESEMMVCCDLFKRKIDCLVQLICTLENTLSPVLKPPTPSVCIKEEKSQPVYAPLQEFIISQNESLDSCIYMLNNYGSRIVL